MLITLLSPYFYSDTGFKVMAQVLYPEHHHELSALIVFLLASSLQLFFFGHLTRHQRCQNDAVPSK
ncbi:uncharacterized protein BT62DRAFT_739775 [Guyanagaster necrorhizus]|uniref:Uncharacterized protein n=1 Tax=Guyanagaster necrorhizus TaxID=856835 RepID=A0A9P7VFT6_9AGAR|nr:uncharacterized protein BT62DRAFT_739775 [Guyanagaster necrorhizus MCA 3950]KAG7439361.1 hypothetical protein BT62DRAFT_739775 [Guyanagaster necrorhizus MCA 3950]